MFPILSRRDLMRHAGLAASAFAAGAGFSTSGMAAAPPSLEAFMSMSSKVTGHTPLDQDMGKGILDAFVSAGRAGEISALIADPAADRSKSEIARAIVAAWYSGLSPLPGAAQVIGFNEALVWDALSYTKPWGSCGGDTGYWGDPPDQEP